MLDLERTRRVVGRQWARFTELLGRTSEADWRTPTRCEGWDVSDLARHVAWGVSMEAEAIERVLVGDDTPATGSELSPDTSRDEVVNDVKHRTSKLVDVLGELNPEHLSAAVPMPYGPTPLPFALQIFAMEAGIHTDDLADAMGEHQSLDPDVVEATGAVLAGSLPVLAGASSDSPPEGLGFRLTGHGVDLAIARRGDSWLTGDAGDTTCVVEGDASALIRFAMGRVPSSDPGLTVRGDSAQVARFKRYFPGP